MTARMAHHALIWSAMVLSIAVVPPAAVQERLPPKSGPTVLFSAPLAEVPGMNLTLVELVSKPNPEPPSTAERHRRGHRHPGTVLVYVTQGALRLALEGGPVQVVRTGETFLEPPRAHHIIAENASATEPARALAIMIVPDGEPLTVPEPD